MKALLISAAFCLFLMQAKAQGVGLLTADQLNQRLSLGKDTVYVINLWATWCAPCVKELPYFERLRKAFPDAKLKVLLLSLDFRSKLETEVKPFVKRMKLTSEVFLVNEKDQQVFIDKVDKSWSGTIPATLIVNSAEQRRQFIPNELTYNELLNFYKLNK
jgi:thiol-disulfide isomerase/thioredoxin